MSTLTNYENFLKATNKSIGFIMAFVQYQLYLNRLHYAENEFVDSTSVTVCKNRYISSHSIFFCCVCRINSFSVIFSNYNLKYANWQKNNEIFMENSK